jgi:hypothetical protein
MIEAVRSANKTIDIDNVNRVLMQPHLSFTSLWSHFLANVAELASDWRMFVTPRIRQKELRAQEFYPAPRSMIFYRTPPLPRTFPRSYD